MDSSIRSLLIAAQKTSGQEKNPALLQAYGQLRNVAESKPAVDAPESFSPDLYVLCAEIAFQNGLLDMSKECLKMYFMKPPPANQFLCRAYLCQAQLLAPTTATNPEQLEKAVVYLLKAISFAKENPRYHFLVYNASVIYWQFCRPFLKANFRQYLARSLHQVVKALDDIEDKDYEWRAQLMIALMECHLDAGKKTDASSIANSAASFIKQNVPSLYKEVFGLIVRNQLMDSSKLHKDVKNSPELAIYYQICKLKVSLENSEPREYYSEIQRLLNQMNVAHTKVLSVSEQKKNIRTMSPTSTIEGDRRSPSKAGRRTPTPVNMKKLAAESAEKPFLLLELARLCLELDFPDLALDCAEHMKTCNVKEQGFYLELEFLQCEIMVRNLAERQETLQKNVVDTRLQAMKRCEEAIMNAIRLGDPNVIQVGCVTQWNLCLPLLQPNLRRHVRKPLTQVAEALEAIQSLLVQLRCQVHTELAKCEEDQEQIQVAMENLKKAVALDDGQIYRERLEVALKQLELRSELYKQPERAEDIACMIIEQARKADSGTMRMKRSLLVKAGEALAPDAFNLVLDSESATKDVTGGKAPLTVIKKLSNKSRQFNKCVQKAKGHLQRLGDENDRERCRLWGDLAKTARKQEVWDVCRVACRFCLLYDDNRWKNAAQVKTDSPKPTERGKTSELTVGDGTASSLDRQASVASRPSSPTQKVPLYDKDLIRMLAEVNFIFGESSVHLLRSEGVELNDAPIPPVDKSKRPKGYVAKKPEEDPDWIEYCDWIKSLSELSTNSFLRGLNLGVELEEAWLVCCGTAYIWNYNNHIFTQLRHREIMDTLTVVYNGLKKVGHAGETMSLVNICNALAFALMKPWIPEPPKDPARSPTPTPPQDAQSNKKGKAPAPGGKGKGPSLTISIASEAMPDLKKAIEVCEYSMEVTNGNSKQDVVPIHIRMPILQTWVSVKQMAQQQISKNLGLEEEPFTEGQRPMSRAIVAVDMFSLSKSGIMEFKEVPPIADIAAMVEECRWTDKFVELQLWTRLTSLAYEQKMHNLVLRCSKKALRFATVGTQPKNRKIEPHRYMVEQEMLSYSSGLLGQSLVDNMSGKNAIRREALSAFLNSARFARNAENYDMVMTAARHYWNACCPLVSQPIERELLREPVRIILQSITDTAEKVKKKEEKSEEEEDPKPGEQTGSEVKEEQTVGGIGAVEDDLTLRAALYGVLFQSYADKKEWEEGLKAMDKAIVDMPRTKHRLLIFKHRVMTKAKLGRSVAMDIQKFKDESEDYVAHMWRRVALSSREIAEQLLSYQNAIEALSSPSNEWLKVELLIEFGQWLYVKEFPLEDSMDQLQWAIDIMLNMQADADTKKEQEMLAAAAAAEAKKAAGKASPNADGRAGKKGANKPPPAKPKVPSAKKDRKSPVAEPSKEGKGEGEAGEDDLNQEGIVPVAKQAVIGVLPANPNLKVQDITDIRVLDGLIRAHVLCAEMIGHGSPMYTDYLLLAYGYLMNLWQASVPHAGPTIKEIAKNPPAAAAEPSNAKGSAKGKKGDKGGKDAAPVKEKPKRKGALDLLPGNLEDWSVYDVPDEVLEAFKHEAMKETGINAHTIQKPMLTLHHLEMLVTHLREVGYNHLTLPVLAFQDMLARDLLKKDALKFLVHTQALEVCLELNLKNGCNFHEKVAGPIAISEDDQAKSRDEIAFWKEKQAQVIKEELKIKETIAKMAADTKTKDKRIPISHQQSLVSESEKPVVSHLGKVLGALAFQDIWTTTAEILIRQGFYQGARDFLNEANTAAVAFDDVALQAKILYLLGVLSLDEAQHGQAVNFCKKAQALYHGDEMFWYQTTILMVNATLQDYENRKSKRMARGILVHSLNEFQRIQDERPNRFAITEFVIGMLEARLAATQWSIIQEDYQDITVPKVMARVHLLSERYEQGIHRLVLQGYKREALPLMKEHAEVLQKMAKVSPEREIRHTYLLQAMLVLKDAVSTADEVLVDVQNLCSLQEIRNMSLPTQRQAADIKICYAEVMLEIFRVHAKEMRGQQLEDQRKGSVLKMVEDFIRATPDYTHMEREWEENVRLVAEEAVSKFLDAHSLAGTIPKLKARAVCGVGQCLRALAMHSSPDPPTQWIVQEMELAKLSHDAEENDEESELDQHSRQFMKYAKQIREMKVADGVCRHYLLQATECLIQALNFSLQKKYTDIAATAALELVECFGQFDVSAASLFLSLFQSCQTALNLEKLLCRAQLDPSQSKLAALLRQRENLLQRDVMDNSSCSVMMSSILTSLESDWQAWKRMEILPNHLDIVREFPSNFNFIILQHSPDKSFLYGSVLDKSKGQAGGGGEKKNPKQQSAPATDSHAPGTSKAKIFGMDTDSSELEELLTKCHIHRQNVQQLLLKQEYQRSQAAMRQKMLENLEDSVTKGAKGSKSRTDDNEREERHLQDEFRDLCMSMEMYLKPIMAHIEGMFDPPVPSPTISSTEKPGREPKEPPPPPQEYAILLADSDLMQLPLEALRALQPSTLVSLSRDFSLQMFYHRYHQDVPAAQATADTGKGAKSASKGGREDSAAAAKKQKAKTGDQPFSRIPGLRDASKKMAKIIPLNRPLNSWSQGVDVMNMRFIVDPHLDCPETEENKPIEVFNKVLEEYEQQFTPRWLGVMGDEHIPSVGEWEIYLIENSSFIFYGMEKLMSYLPPAKLSALNIPDCMLVYLLDMAQTTNSFTRQSKMDVLKSSNVLSLEKPVETAMLMSLTGVKCVMENQWHCTLAENANKLNTTMKDLLEAGLSTGEAARMLFTPYRRKLPVPEGGEEGEHKDDTASQAGDKTKDENHSQRSGSVTDRSNTSDKTQTTVIDMKENIDIQRSWYNLVCYGLPNLIITQLS